MMGQKKVEKCIWKKFSITMGRELAFENFFRSIFFWNIRNFQKFKKFS